MPVTVCVAGDVMLDVLVRTQAPLQPDDDTDALITLSAGGQAANVAAWVTRLGGAARLYGPRCADSVGHLLDGRLVERGIGLYAEPLPGRSGAVVSMVTSGTRTMASDPGDVSWIGPGLAEPAWLAGAGWLHLSGYLLLRAPDPQVLLATGRSAQSLGVALSLDLASAGMILDYGSRRFADLVDRLRPALVLGNEGEWDALGLDPSAYPGVAVVKRGPAGMTVLTSGEPVDFACVPGPVVDVTGAGDALAAGYLVGGPELAIRAAAECVASLGAQPASAMQAVPTRRKPMPS